MVFCFFFWFFLLISGFFGFFGCFDFFAKMQVLSEVSFSKDLETYPGIVTLTIPYKLFHLHLKMLEVIVKNRVVVGINTGHELGFFNFGFFV